MPAQLLATAIATSTTLASPSLGCVVILWGFGALCAAAGIGGGGMIVSILMFMGDLSPRDAVPVSKAVVFLGAIVSLALNIGRNAAGSSKPLVDMLLLKMVVPMALLGTLIGVMTNEHTPGWGVLVVLVSMMVPTFLLVTRRAQQQHFEERNAEAKMKDIDEAQGLLESDSPDSPGWSVIDAENGKWPPPCSLKQAACTWVDFLLLGCLLVIVISGGVMQHHVRACFEQQQKMGYGISPLGAPDSNILSTSHSCQHPVLSVAFWGRAEALLAEKGYVSTMLMVMLAIPVWACFSTGLYYAGHSMKQGWSRNTVACYLSIGLVAGCLAGFVGIGGGLIFSPFFLLMGVDPSVAVATSSTCVVFTSSSTAIQYFLMDRIQVDLALMYGSVNALASLCGTAFVQHIGERWAMKKSYITFIVAFGLAVSIAISSIKCSQLVRMAMQGLPT